MSAGQQPANDLPRLLSALEDGTLTEGDEARLAELLQSDPAARARYYEHVMLSALLRREGRRAAARDENSDLARPEVKPRPVVEAVSGRRRFWLLAAAASLLLALAISVSEATGVTQLVPTIIRVVTGEGSLVIEVDDPTVSVTLDGQDITITGAGIHELKLRPGTHRFVATKHGQPAHTELVTIQKGQRKVVSVRLEPANPPGSSTAALPIPPLVGHTGPVWCVAFTPDSRRLISASQDGTARVWDVATRAEVARFSGHEDCVFCVAVSPDGTRVLSGSGGLPWVAKPADGRWSLCSWELATGKELQRTSGSADAITSIAISADGGRALLGYYSGKVVLWDTAAWREVKSISTSPLVWSVGFSPDQRQVVVGSGSVAGDEQGTLGVWDLDSGAERSRLAGHKLGVWRATFARGGKQIVSTGGDRAVRIWNAETGALVRHFPSGDVTTGLAISDDGKFLLTGNYGVGKTVSLWNLLTNEQVQAFDGHTLGVQSVALSPDGRWAASGSHDCTVRLWDVGRLWDLSRLPASPQESTNKIGQ